MVPMQSAETWQASPTKTCSKSAASRKGTEAALSAGAQAAGTRTTTGPSPIMRDPNRVAILISGRGSNMRALVEHAAGYDVVLIASNKPHAAGLDWARDRGLPTWTWDSKGADKERWDRALSRALDDHRVGTIALAGFMRILSPWFIAEWRGRVVNIHPSLLPKYRGLDAHKRALEAGDEVSGCSG